ncbi:uncharacterized protein BCR38DRAFT_454053 [Pseudomassariella vexata]|uniref:Uncharacterized protein n=1 Tax=Pseudomassariella vexata TaxID=1141098 RepID=A0A1Y2EIY9_9PEZI|nr:uncharacterized protein BCR38DRAFT_454053 [Pseudomassariella vexata]ORY71552.1 hypothetical protein BCR38DRAFT_454053 [Pseudomassariella vexata]
MSAHASPSPSQKPTVQIDESKLPNGQCRYILLNPEVKGHRCACVGFTLNRSSPGVLCDCGHQSCYHVKEAEQPTDKQAWEQLIRRVQLLEDQLDHEKQGGLGNALAGLVSRLGDLEEQYERSKDEISQETRGMYRQVSHLWQQMDQMARQQAQAESRFVVHDERLDHQENSIQSLGDRMMEHDDMAIDLEDRLDRLQDEGILSVRRRRMSSSSESDVSKNSNPTFARGRTRHGPPNDSGATSSVSRPLAERGSKSSPTGSNVCSQVTGPWTVHVSLLPTKSQPFPFEKDTNAYKRCLSRGLHQMIAVRGTESESFVRAVSKTFGSLLQERSWVPLQARLCDAETLLGLPMLRPLDPSLVGEGNYDMDFLRAHCAVVGPNGKIDSLYIAMELETFSWQFLRKSPCYVEDLEDAWGYDSLLDEEDRPSAGDIVRPLPGKLKRAASELSRTPSFSSGETEGSRPKIARTTCIPVPVELRRQVETA